MTQRLRVATCQFPVSGSIMDNAKFIRRLMKKSAGSEAQLVHFPETALSGYGDAGLTPPDSDNWQALEEQTGAIASLAKTLGLWVILGSCRKAARQEKPANCIYAISDKGEIAGIYAKRKLTPAEAAWYTPGEDLLTLTIDGIECGFLICYELCFPDLFKEYREKGVQLIFHSCYNVSRKPRPLFQALTLAQLRTRAADHQMWISSANSSARYSFSTACLARPDGSVESAKKHTTGILFHDFPDTHLGWTYDNRE